MSKKINETYEIKGGGVEGLDSTLKGMEQWDMNVVNDVDGKHPEFNGPKNTGGSK